MVVSAWGSFGPIVGASSTDSNRELGYPPEKQTLSPPNVGRDPARDNNINGIERKYDLI